MPWIPRITARDDGVDIVHHMRDVEPEEYANFHPTCIFSRLKPGQRYTSILSDCT